MQNMKSVSDSSLLEKIRTLVADERTLALQILHLLRETDARKLHLALGYSSLFTFCVEELKYSESQAYRRVSAMRALVAVPEIESRLASGSLSIATVSQVQSFFQARRKETDFTVSADEKKDLFVAIENKSKREVEKLLASICPESPRAEQVRPLDGERSEIRLSISNDLLAKLRKIQDLSSHSNPERSLEKTLEKMAEMVLDKIDPERKKSKPASSQSAPSQSSPSKSTPSQSVSRMTAGNQATSPGKFVHAKTVTQTVPAQSRRFVWKVAAGRCGFISSITGLRCSETRFLQIDHRIPRATGGTHTTTNLRLLCRAHNLYEARRVFGAKKMARFYRI